MNSILFAQNIILPVILNIYLIGIHISSKKKLVSSVTDKNVY